MILKYHKKDVRKKMKAIEYTEKSKKVVEDEISRYKHAKKQISKAERTPRTWEMAHIHKEEH